MSRADTPNIIAGDEQLSALCANLQNSKVIYLDTPGNQEALLLADHTSRYQLKADLLNSPRLQELITSPTKTILTAGGKTLWKKHLQKVCPRPPRFFDLDLTKRLLGRYCPTSNDPFELMSQSLRLIKKMEMDKVAALEFRLIPVVAAMEAAGLRIDVPRWRDLVNSWNQKIDSVLTRLAKFCPIQHNQPDLFGNTQRLSARQLHNPDFVRDLFGKNSLHLPDFTEETLRRYDHPLANLMLEFRHYDKLRTSFGDPFLAAIDSSDRVHSEFDQLGTDTGRFTSKNPNVQQIPRDLRSLVVPASGNLLITADYSQIELRILAELSGDRIFAAIFASGKDLHSITAAEMFRVPLDRVDKKLRSAAKAINFGLMYGRGPTSLARQLRISTREASELIEKYFTRYRRIREFLEATSNEALTTGYCQTSLGRRRYFTLPDPDDPHYDSKIAQIRRQARNSPIQGTSADMIKLALLNVHRAMKKWYGSIVNTVHDEIVVEVPRQQAEQARREVEKAMLAAGRELLRSIPVQVNVNVGTSWEK